MSKAREPVDPFSGTWLLLPETCDYDRGEPPRAGTYTIREEGESLTFDMAWEDAQGEHHKATFVAIPDGETHPFSGPGVDALSLTRVDEVNLVSIAYHRDTPILHAVRTLSEDHAAMRVVQSGLDAEGKTWENLSLYRRQPASPSEES